ncbi:hypothetical protein ACGFZ9_09275 [Streptomyces mirabilis]|uniref:hypothetical protein n=1 Tax=Streptomyces mirabilis TaxID=68239 RepID=UPI0037146033
MSDDVLTTTEDGRFRVRLVRDEDAANPREDGDNLVHVITIDTHLGQYEPVDKDGGPLAAEWECLKWNRWEGIDLFTRYVATEHGGIVLESAPEKGPRSLWYMTNEEILDLDRGLLSEGYIEAEKEEYEAWLAGDVWGFVVEETADRESAKPEWQHVDSFSGYYGGPDARAQAREALRFYAGRAAGTGA